MQPNSILTGLPISSSGFDNSQIVDWYAYFYEPITYLEVELIQTHNLTASNIQTNGPQLGSPSVAVNCDLFADNITTSAPILGSSELSQSHDLSVIGILSGQVVVSSSGLVQIHSFQANDLESGTPNVPNADAVENETFSTSSILAGQPELASPQLTQVYNLDSSDVVTRNPDLGSPTDPNQIIQREIREIEQMFGGWQRRAYEVPDGRLVQAEREIYATYGQKVSIDAKSKSLIKFGKSAPLATNNLQTVWTVGGNETYATGNTIDSISSSNANDTQIIFIECHTVDEDGNFSFLVQSATLNGQNRVALETPVARVSQIYNGNGTNLLGRVVVYENTALSGGIPTDATKIHIDIPAGLQSSFKAATTFSSTDYYILTGGFGSVSLKQSGAADFYLEVRRPNGVFLEVAAISGSSGSPWQVELDPAVIVPRNADVRVRVETDTNNMVVYTVFKGYLAKVIG